MPRTGPSRKGRGRSRGGRAAGRSHKQVDLVLTYEGTRRSVELRTFNTNWRCESCQNLNRPITDNIDGVIADVRGLRRLPSDAGALRLVLFTLFPVPAGHVQEFSGAGGDAASTKVGSHVARLVREASIGPEDLAWSEVETGMPGVRILAFCLPVGSTAQRSRVN